jgi:transposase InsO family protein
MVAQKHKKLHEIFGVSKSSLYYKSRKYEKDFKLKEKIEKVWNDFPSYGHKRLALELKLNKKRVLRVMKKFSIRPYRRHRKPFKRSIVSIYDKYPNLLVTTPLVRINQIWVTDFTYLWYKNRFIYVATVIDIYNREVVGVCVLTNHSSALVIQALVSALMDHPKPDIIHSDQGSEYTAEIFQDFCISSGIQISMSEKGSPWQNGYQESFYDKFKIDLGDPNRFESLGELVFAIYRTIYVYNTTRIHTTLKMSPREFALKNCSS